LAIPVLADQLILKNGDKLTGTIVKSDGKELVLKTDYAGDVTVKFDAIQSLTSSGDLHVTMGGKTAVGPVTTTGDNVVVATKAGEPVEAPKTSVTLVRSPAEQAAYEKSLHPGFAEGWAGGLNLGFAVTRGNSETKNLAIAFNAVRTGFHDKLSLYTNSIYSSNDVTGATPHTTANSIGGGVRYDHDFNPRVFGFVTGDFFHNSLQFLDLRSSFGGGIGLHAVKNPNTTLDFLGGINYTHESYSGIPLVPPPGFYSYTKSYAAAVVGDTFAHKLGKNTDVIQSFFFYPDLNNTSDYRWTLNAGTVTKINKWLGWQNSFGDVFVSDGLRPVGTKANDLQISTGINVSFTH
jgi:putative salt-induced outer membrane protein YdiY